MAAPPLLLSFGALLSSSRRSSPLLVEVPYYLISPGDARSVGELISVGEGTQVFDPEGKILFTTVALAGKVNIYDALAGWLDEDVEVVHEDQITGGKPRRRSPAQLQPMDDSKLVATRVALEHLGYRVSVHGGGASSSMVVPGSPADGQLEPGDIIVSVDGVPVTAARTAVTKVRQHKPGDVIEVAVRRGEATGASRPAQPITGPDGAARSACRCRPRR